MKALLIWPEFPETFWSFKHAVRFVRKKASNPPLGLLTVAAMLPKEWDLRLIDLNVTSLTDADLAWAESVWISAMTVQRKSVEQVIRRCKEFDLPIVAGGPLFTGEHEKFPEIDHFVLNEAELTLPPFLRDLELGTPKRLYATDEFANLSLTPIPRWDLLDLNQYDSMSVQFTRGCPYNCDFCNVTALLGHVPRFKTTQQLIAELDELYRLGWRRNIFFVDDNFIGNKRVLKSEVLPALIEWRKGKRGCLFLTEASINLADDRALLDMMVAAGFTSVFIGIETPDEASLAECHKSQNKNRDLIESVKRIQRAGMQVMGGFIVGFDSDNESIFQRQIEFIQKSGIVTAMVGLLQAPFGTRLYERLRHEGRLLDEITGDNTDGTTNIVPKMNVEVLMNGYRHILETIFSPEMFYERIRTLLKELQPARQAVVIQANEFFALLSAIYHIGLRGPARREFWRLFFWSLFTCPEKFPLAITLSIYGYHFRQISNLAGAGKS